MSATKNNDSNTLFVVIVWRGLGVPLLGMTLCFSTVVAVLA